MFCGPESGLPISPARQLSAKAHALANFGFFRKRVRYGAPAMGAGAVIVIASWDPITRPKNQPQKFQETGVPKGRNHVRNGCLCWGVTAQNDPRAVIDG